jgi:2,5-diketo-D-gluconate reductase B
MNDIPMVGLGTWKIVGQASYDQITTALRLGYRHIDTAELYGNEEPIGRAIKDFGIPREEVFVTTKVWVDHHEYNHFKEAVNKSLRRLQMDYVDLVLIHRPSETIPMEESIQAMVELKAEGKTHRIGVSNFSAREMNEAVLLTRQFGESLFCNQSSFSLEDKNESVKRFCEASGTKLVAYTPLGRGRFLNDPMLIQMAHKYEKSVAQIALRWITQQAIPAIVLSTYEPHMKSNLELDFAIDPKDMESLNWE